MYATAEKGSSARLKSAGLLLIVALASYLIGNERVSLWDRDEPRYAQTSRQMLQSGDWVVPHLYDAVRTAKPVLIYWCQASCMAVFGDTAAAARLPSALAMTATLTIVMIGFGRQRGLFSAFILGSSLLVFWSAKSALTDSVLLLFITIAQLCTYRLWRGDRRWRCAILLAIALGFGCLTKGPVALAMPGVTLLGLWLLRPSLPRRLQASSLGKIVVAVAIIALIVGPWLWLVEHRAPGYLRAAIGKEVIDRARNPQEGHAGPPGYYLLTIWVMYFPWSLLLPAAMIGAWRRRRVPAVRFALAAVIGPWIMLEIVRTKLPHYLLPAYPFLAFLTADLLRETLRGRDRSIITAGFRHIVTGWAILVSIIGLLPWLLVRQFTFSFEEAIGLVVFSTIAIEWTRQVRRAFVAGRPILAAQVMGCGMFVLIVALHVGFLTAADFLQVSRRVSAVLHDHAAAPTDHAIMIDYKEPSLAFYQGGTIREEARDNYLSTVPPLLWPKWIIITRDRLNMVPIERRALLDEVGDVHGLDVAGKGMVDVVVLKNEP